MNKLLSAAAIATLSSLISLNAFAAEPQIKMSVMTMSNTATIRITENGKPVNDFPITIKGHGTDVYKTSHNGSVVITNYYDVPTTYTFSITEPNGNVISSKRLVSRS
jgi:uncharacterized membrane protein